VLKARSAAVLRTGAAALGSARALVDLVLAPALEGAGVPADAVQLVPGAGHAGADALVGLPDLVPLVVVRGSGEVTRRLGALGAAAGVRILAHADGGGVLYLDASAAEDDVTRLVTDSTDRLGVCNRLNLLLVDRSRLRPAVAGGGEGAAGAGITPSLPPHAHPLGHEWALDAGAEAHVTVAPVDGPVEAGPHRRPGDLRPGRVRVCHRRGGRARVPRRLHRHRRVLEHPDPPARRLQAARPARDRDQRRSHARAARSGHLPGPGSAAVRRASRGLIPPRGTGPPVGRPVARSSSAARTSGVPRERAS
jgi:hypothetical protein